MKKKILAVAAMGIMAAGTAHASGYRIPEQSINGVALSNAYIAHTEGPDTAYYNPANMGWQEDRWQMEVSASYINLPHIDYTDYRSSTLDGSSQTENIVVPMFHAVSPDYNNFRFGFAFVVPYGLSKRWNDPFPRTSSEEFTLKVFEANPSLSYKFCDWFGLAAGARILHTTGNTVKSSGYIDIDPGPGVTYASISRDMDGDSTDLGYNLAMTIKPTKEWNIAATYRSEVDMGLTGSARLYDRHLLPLILTMAMPGLMWSPRRCSPSAPPIPFLTGPRWRWPGTRPTGRSTVSLISTITAPCLIRC